jgi:hypothetical protein
VPVAGMAALQGGKADQSGEKLFLRAVSAVCQYLHYLILRSGR